MVALKWVQQKQVTVPHLLLEHYTRLNINETELVLLIQIQRLIDSGDSFPTPQTLSEQMTLSVEDCAEKIGQLVRKRLLLIKNSRDEETNMMYEYCSLEPLWMLLIQHLETKESEKHGNKAAEQEGQLFQQFEQEFARPLSPIEVETISMWIDQDTHTIALIQAALKEAVISGKLNFRYIDRILFEWQRNGIKTVEQAHAHSERFRKKTPIPTKEKERRQAPTQSENIPGFNWLENL
ncbi:DnaD domain-containing protein [Alkalihalobacillus sp. LMS6]|uniref:DnaD domain-containing protein n=1 Tax=Bacillaceae TaxID=186817 RepID=UPI0020D0C68C|nr:MULTISPECIES: DnaD domain-containing protein [Bacillaceae]UTR08490.1 DnaD domain-containing protein [Alkalihalobacillus sp. LMS6]